MQCSSDVFIYSCIQKFPFDRLNIICQTNITSAMMCPKPLKCFEARNRTHQCLETCMVCIQTKCGIDKEVFLKKQQSDIVHYGVIVQCIVPPPQLQSCLNSFMICVQGDHRGLNTEQWMLKGSFHVRRCSVTQPDSGWDFWSDAQISLNT